MHFTVYSSVDVYLGHFQFRVTVNNAAITFLYVCFGIRMNGFLFVALLRLDLWDIYSNLGGPYKDFLSGCTSSRFQHQFMSVLVSLNTCQHLELSNFLIVAIMVGG